MYHDFKRSLKKGQEGEELFLRLWPDKLKKLDGRKHDFVSPEGYTLELKTDSYSMEKTPNFFIERFSNLDKQSLGGPFQALQNGTDYWVYFFPSSMTAFIFDTHLLVQVLVPLIHFHEPKLIPNRNYTTVGYAIPRSLLLHICSVQDFNLKEAA